MLIVFYGFHPSEPSSARNGIRPTTIVLQNFGETNHPRSELDVDVREIITQKERAFWIRCLDDFGNFSLKFLTVFYLFFQVLCLENAVE